MIIKTANGYYMPSYFFIHIESDEDLESIVLNNQQTFAHEYIHFLQDLILPYCIRTNMTTISQLSCVNKSTLDRKELIRPFDKWNEDCNITMEQLQYTWGDSQFIDPVNSINNINKEYFTIPSGPNVYKHIIDIGSKKYQVGARDFLEYIAHKIESKHWNIDTYDFPYRTVDKLFEYYKLSDIPTEVRLCIVEYCLYNDNPIHMFLNLFIDQGVIKDNKSIFLSYDTCKEFLLGVGWSSRGDFNEDIFSKTRRRLSDFKTWLSNQYKHNQYSDIKKWVENVSEYTEKNLSNRFIFSELYSLDLDNFMKRISKISIEIGIPLLFNDKHKCACMLPEGYNSEQFTQFYVMLGFMNYINSKDDSCPVADFCKANSQFYKKECLTELLKAIESIGLCPFSLFLKSYGFNPSYIRKAP